MTSENSLASELLHEVKMTNKRLFIIVIITVALLFISNIAWLIAWNLPTDELTTTTTTESLDLDQSSTDNGSNFYNEGELNYGKTDSSQN